MFILGVPYNLYYNQDNSRYYISIDNSTDEYYLVDVQYSPTFVTVNYTYNTTNNNYEKVGDVTNVYYYELKDGRNSSTLTASEVAGLDLDYDVANYELVTDEPNTLSLQHFDSDYTDSSSFNQTFYSQNRSTNYVDNGAFGKAVTLPSGSAAGVTIPGLSGYSSLSFDFRVYYNDISSLGVYFGDTCILQKIPEYRSWSGSEVYSDNGKTIQLTDVGTLQSSYTVGRTYTYPIAYTGYSGTVSSSTNVPTSAVSPSYTDTFSANSKVRICSGFSAPAVHARNRTRVITCYRIQPMENSSGYKVTYSSFTVKNEATVEYRSTPTYSVFADFTHEPYKNQWVSMRITIANGYIISIPS